MPPPLKTCCRPSVALHRPTQNNGRPWGESSHDGDSDRGHADFLALAASLYQAAWGALSRGALSPHTPCDVRITDPIVQLWSLRSQEVLWPGSGSRVRVRAARLRSLGSQRF